LENKKFSVKVQYKFFAKNWPLDEYMQLNECQYCFEDENLGYGFTDLLITDWDKVLEGECDFVVKDKLSLMIEMNQDPNCFKD